MSRHLMDRIELDPRVCNGKPVVRGTRITVSLLLELLAEGESWESVLAGYPELTPADLRAVLLFAKESLENSEVESLAA